jgi:hypothetical protein
LKSANKYKASYDAYAYWEAWGGDYKGKILLLGISYDSKTMRHSSKVERAVANGNWNPNIKV